MGLSTAFALRICHCFGACGVFRALFSFGACVGRRILVFPGVPVFRVVLGCGVSLGIGCALHAIVVQQKATGDAEHECENQE
ncbi:MAG: hypothetical protein GY772_00015 [bacterium]|nr:hypothetical protein [bacterium]